MSAVISEDGGPLPTVEEDVCVRIMQEETEEGKKVARLGGRKHFAVFRRLHDDEIQLNMVLNLWDSV
jgi:hypothetical protein